MAICINARYILFNKLIGLLGKFNCMFSKIWVVILKILSTFNLYVSKDTYFGYTCPKKHKKIEYVIHNIFQLTLCV